MKDGWQVFYVTITKGAYDVLKSKVFVGRFVRLAKGVLLLCAFNCTGLVAAQDKTFSVAAEGPIAQMALSPNGEFVALTGVRTNSREEVIIVFNLKKEKTVAEFQGKAEVLVFAKDSKHLISYLRIRNGLGQLDDQSSTVVAFWGIQSGKWEKNEEIKGRAFGITDRFVLTQGYPGYKYAIAADLESRKTVELKGVNSLMKSGTASSDGKYVVTVADKGPVTVWDASTGKRLFSVETPTARPARFFPKDSLLAIGSAFYELPSGKQVKAIPTRAMAISADCKLTASHNKEAYVDRKTNKTYFLPEAVYVYSRENGDIIASFETHNNGFCSHLFFTPDGRFLVGGCGPGIIQVWDLSKGKFQPPEAK